MLDPTKDGIPSKCMFTLGQLPKFNDAKQPPTKTKPFSTILEQPFLHTLNLILPFNFYNASNSAISTTLSAPKFATLKLSLPQILSNSFFTTYIKTGTIALHSIPTTSATSSSQPALSNDPLITLYNGLLRLELPRDIYERTGLSGNPIRSGHRKHMPDRFLVETNLRLPSMVVGRKGFERLKRGLEAVLAEERSFLFADLQGDVTDRDSPVWTVGKEVEVRQVSADVKVRNVKVPRMKVVRGKTDHGIYDALFEERVLELAEWVDLVAMGSPRVDQGDDIDAFLSRYSVPGEEIGETKEQEVVCVRWKGFFPSEWARDLLTLCLNAARKDQSHWLAVTGLLFRTAAVDGKLGWTILRLPEEETVAALEGDSEQGDEDLTAGDDEDTVMSDANAGESSGTQSKKTKSNEGKQNHSKPPKPFPQFLLYEWTAGEHG